MVEQGDDVVGHLIDGVDFLRLGGAAAAARIVQDQLCRLRQRQLRRFPHFTGKRRRRHQH